MITFLCGSKGERKKDSRIFREIKADKEKVTWLFIQKLSSADCLKAHCIIWGGYFLFVS